MCCLLSVAILQQARNMWDREKTIKLINLYENYSVLWDVSSAYYKKGYYDWGKFPVCVNCGHRVRELYKRYSNTLKTTNCEKCHQVTDKYIEFEEFIILIDALLLDSSAFRHIIYNGDFKLYWKVSLVVLLLESFALCRQKLSDPANDALNVHEKGFYTYTLHHIGDYLLITFFLLLITAALGIDQIKLMGVRSFTLTIIKVVVISNLSKFFLLPILVWRNNTTVFGRSIHYVLVMGHHLCSLVLAYEAVGSIKSHLRWLSITLVILAFVLKEYIRHHYAAFQLQLHLT